jgi:hypothetical protein
MAGPTVLVRVLGDIKGLAGSFKEVGKQADSASGRMHDAFQSVLGTLNKSGVLGPFGDSLAQIDDAFARLESDGHRVGQVMLGLGGVFAGIGVGLSALGSKDVAARQQLRAAIEATGSSWEDYAKQIETAVKHNERFADSAAQTENALQILTEATGSPQKALDLLGEATDLAAAKHESLSEAATQLGKVYNGSTKLLKEFGITVDSVKGATRDATTATHQARTADSALAAAKQRLADIEEIDATKKKLTAAQALNLKNAQEKVQTATANAAGAHQKLAAAQAVATAAANNQHSAVSVLANKLQGQASASADTFTGRLKALGTAIEDQAAQIGAKYGPQIDFLSSSFSVLGGLVTAGRTILDQFSSSTAAAAAANKTLAASSETAGTAMEGEAAAAAAVETATLPLIATMGLVVAAAAALGVAVYEVRRHWQGLVDFFTGLSFADIGKTMFKGLVDAFIWAINLIIDVWNGLQFKVPGISVFGHRIGGETIGLPDIPRIPSLAAGGLITADGLIYAHAGETVVPAGRAGPAVVVNNAQFASDVDIDLFMRRVAWTVQTQRI